MLLTRDSGRLLQLAQDAKLTLDGQAVTRSSNTVDDAIEGVTLTLQGVSGKDASGAWKSSRLAIAIDPSAAAERVQLVDDDVFASVAPTRSPQGVLAVVEEPRWPAWAGRAAPRI